MAGAAADGRFVVELNTDHVGRQCEPLQPEHAAGDGGADSDWHADRFCHCREPVADTPADAMGAPAGRGDGVFVGSALLGVVVVMQMLQEERGAGHE